MQTPNERVTQALAALKRGEMIVLTDASDRENEGDLVLAASAVTKEKMNFIIRNSSGIVCLSLTNRLAQNLELEPMVDVAHNSSPRHTPFTVSIDAKEGITTGVSAYDRAVTVQAVMRENANASDFVKPGHLFPLIARDGGVLERQGHTEGALDLIKLSGLGDAAILCELMNADGTMMRGDALNEFSHTHQLIQLSIEDILTYRLQTENLIADEASAMVPLEKYGTFKMTVFKEKFTGQEHIVLTKKSTQENKPLLVRIHSACMSGDLFSSKRCDCHPSLHHALTRMSEEGGMLIYLNQEGRGIGLLNKMKAYALQEQGFDTVDANKELKLPIDARNYFFAANILRALQVDDIRLLTNNPDKLKDLIACGIKVSREPTPVFHDEHNLSYLKTKKEKLKHLIDFAS